MDPNQGLCLGALFDIAATNVSTLPIDLISFELILTSND